MGLVRRLKRITSGKIEAFLSSVDDPSLVLPQLVSELEQKVRLAARAEAKARAAVKAAQRRLDETTGRVMRLGKGAELALQQGDETTARDALAAQVEAEKEMERQQEILAQAEEALRQAQEARAQLGVQLEELKQRKDQILARVSSVSVGEEAGKTAAGRRASGEGLLDAVAAMEQKLDEQEADIQVGRDVTHSVASLDERLRGVERDAEIESRLARLRKRRKNK